MPGSLPLQHPPPPPNLDLSYEAASTGPFTCEGTAPDPQVAVPPVAAACDCSLQYDEAAARLEVMTFTGHELPVGEDFQGKTDTVVLVESPDSTNPCKLRVSAMLRTKRGEAYIGYVQVDFGLHPSSTDRYGRKIRLKAGRQETIQIAPMRAELVLPHAYFDGQVTMDETETNVYHVYDPSCGWSVRFLAGDLERLQRSLVVTADTALASDALCGACD